MSKTVEAFLEKHPYLTTFCIFVHTSISTFHFFEAIIKDFLDKFIFHGLSETVHEILFLIFIFIFPLTFSFTYFNLRKKHSSATPELKKKKNNLIDRIANGSYFNTFIILITLIYSITIGFITISTKLQANNSGSSISPVSPTPSPISPNPVRVNSERKKYNKISEVLNFGNTFFDDETNASITLEGTNTFGKAKGTVNLPNSEPIHDERITAGSRWNFKTGRKYYTLTILKINPEEGTYQARVSEN